MGYAVRDETAFLVGKRPSGMNVRAAPRTARLRDRSDADREQRAIGAENIVKQVFTEID